MTRPIAEVRRTRQRRTSAELQWSDFTVTSARRDVLVLIRLSTRLMVLPQNLERRFSDEVRQLCARRPGGGLRVG